MAEQKFMMGNTRRNKKKTKKIGRKSETERIRVVEDRDEKDYKKDKTETENVEREKYTKCHDWNGQKN